MCRCIGEFGANHRNRFLLGRKTPRPAASYPWQMISAIMTLVAGLTFAMSCGAERRQLDGLVRLAPSRAGRGLAKNSGMLLGPRLEPSSHSTLHSETRSPFSTMYWPGVDSLIHSNWRMSTSGCSEPAADLANAAARSYWAKATK